MGKLVIIFTILLLSLPASAQTVCYSPTTCEGKRAEVTPLDKLAKCEDYKAKAESVPKLMLAERKQLVAVSKCKALTDVFAFQLTTANLELGKERDARHAAESRVVFVAVVVAIVTAAVSIGGAFLVASLAD